MLKSALVRLNSPQMEHKFLTEGELCRLLGINRNTMRRLRHRNRAPRFVRLTTKILYETRDVNEWLENLKLRSTREPITTRQNSLKPGSQPTTSRD